MYEPYEHTPEEENANYLRDNPALESGLWAEWVEVVCGWEKIPYPNQEEWSYLKSRFYSGKAPVDSVAELKQRRSQINP